MSQVVPFASNALTPAHEKRLVLRVLELWRRANQSDELPRAGSVTPANTGADIEYVYMIDVADRASPRFTHIGEALRSDAGPPGHDTLVAECLEESVLGLSSRNWREIVDRRVPVTRGGIGRHEGGAVLYRSIMMPFVDETGRITVIMGAVNWRAVEEQDGRSIA